MGALVCPRTFFWCLGLGSSQLSRRQCREFSGWNRGLVTSNKVRKDPAEPRAKNLHSLPSRSLKHQEGKTALQPGCPKLMVTQGAQASGQEPADRFRGCNEVQGLYREQ